MKIKIFCDSADFKTIKKFNNNSARYDPSCPVIPVIKAVFFGM